MASDLSLLFKLKAQNQASPAIHAVQADVSKLTKTTSTEFNAMQQVATTALGKVTSSLTGLAGQLPVVGNAVSGLSSELSTMAGTTAAAGTEFAALAGPIGIAVVGMGALTFGIIQLGQAVFDASQAAAEFRGQFADLSQQIGVSAETLSGLEVLASNTGGTIQTVTASLGIFQKGLEAAHDPTSKEAELLKKLGVDSLDTETALRQTLKGLYDMGEGAAQTTAVLDLFGRGGRFINAILKESHGDLDEATRRFREMGLEVGGPAAAAADQFNDSYNLLSRQLTAISHQLVSDTIPVFTLLFQDISKGLTGNEDDWRSWRSVVQIETAGAIAAVQTFVQFIASRGNLSFGSLFESNFQGLLDRTDQLINKTRIEADQERLQRLTASILAGKVGDGVGVTPKKKTGLSDEEKQAEKELKFWEQLAADLGRVTDEFLGVNTASKTYAVQQSINNGILSKASSGLQEMSLSAAANFDKITAQTKATKEYEKFLAAQTEQVRLATDGEKSHLQIANELIKSLAEQGKYLSENEEYWLRFNANILDTNELLEKTIENFANLKRTFDDVVPDIDLRDRLSPLDQEGDVPIDIGEPPPELSVWETAIESLYERLLDFSSFIDNTFIASLEGVAGALANGVEAWALYGGSFADAMKQSIAALAAKIAAEATLQAALHAAYAIASLAFGDFGSAARHAIAAAKFAAIAGGAALGARALAGGSFNQSSGDSSSSSSGRSSGTRNNQSQNQPLAPIDLPRNAQAQQHLIVKIQPPDGWVGQEFRKDYTLNGVTRLTILTDGQS